MAQCSKTTAVCVLGMLNGQGGRCSRRATYIDAAGNLFCKQHAKVGALATAPTRNRIREGCIPINTATGKPYQGAAHPSETKEHKNV